MGERRETFFDVLDASGRAVETWLNERRAKARALQLSDTEGRLFRVERSHVVTTSKIVAVYLAPADRRRR